MLKFYLGRELAESLSLPLSRWKRWSREFLPPDPLGGLQSGYARQYSLRDAFAVYLAGYLVSETGYSIPEARKILQDLNEWLKKNVIEHYEAAPDGNGDRMPQTAGTDLMILPICGQTPPAFTYRIRSVVSCQPLGGGRPRLWQEQYTEEIINPGEPRAAACYPNCPRWVAISAVAGHFFECLGAKKT